MKFVGNHVILRIQNGRLHLNLIKSHQILGKYGRFMYHMGPGGGRNVFKWCCINSTASSAAKETWDSEEKEDSVDKGMVAK